MRLFPLSGSSASDSGMKLELAVVAIESREIEHGAAKLNLADDRTDRRD
jgi:hypothetical protein